MQRTEYAVTTPTACFNSVPFKAYSRGPRPKTNPSADRFQYRARGVILEAIYAPDEVWGRDYSKPRCRANMATLYTPTCPTCSERFPGPPSPKPNECLHFDLESCNLMCIYTVVTDPCHIPPLAQARP